MSDQNSKEQAISILDELRTDLLPSKPRILFMGTPDFAVPSLRALSTWCQEHGGEVVAVVSQPDRPKGRGRKLVRTPVASAADELGLICHQWPKLNQSSYDTLSALNYDLAVVIAYGKILPRRYLTLPPWGCINLHASLLPAYRGAAPIQWAVIEGMKETGVSVMRLDEGMDTGPVAHQLHQPISSDTTSATLFESLALLSAQALVEVLDRWVDPQAELPIIFEAQPEVGVSHAKLLQKTDGELDWKRPAPELDQLLRGVTPWPGGQAMITEGVLKVHQASLWSEDQVETLLSQRDDLPSLDTLQAGVIIALLDQGPLIRCTSGALLLTQVQRPSKRATSGGDFCRGYPLRVGSLLSSC